jgi:hypothetical protein
MFKFKTLKKIKKMKINIILILFLLILLFFLFFVYKTYEGFNSEYPQSRYKPSTTTAMPTALDGTPYVSPDKNGACPSDFERDQTNPKSLCHAVCKEGKFYHIDNKVYGCVLLNTAYPQTNYSTATYPYAKDNKTNIVSPTIDAKCPNYFDLDLRSGLCYTKCNGDDIFYGEAGCAKLNTKYLQTIYDGSDNPYPIAADGTTKYISPTSTASCPNKFSLDYSSGICHTECPSGTKFNGKNSGSTIIGCN